MYKTSIVLFGSPHLTLFLLISVKDDTLSLNTLIEQVFYLAWDFYFIGLQLDCGQHLPGKL